MQGSIGAPIRATRKAVLMDTRNGLLGNGYAQGTEQIADARKLHPGAGNPSNRKRLCTFLLEEHGVSKK